jgi:hypothetical protein
MKKKTKIGRPKIKRSEKLFSRTFNANDATWERIVEEAEKRHISASAMVLKAWTEWHEIKEKEGAK